MFVCNKNQIIITTHKIKLIMKNLFISKQLPLVLIMLFSSISNTISQTIYYDNDTQLYGIIDSTGKNILKPTYDSMTMFEKELSRFTKNGMVGLINEKGTIIIQPISDDVYFSQYGFNDGLISVRLNGKYGYYSETGALIIPHLFNSAGQFCDGKAWVKVNGKYCFINKKGEYILDKWFDEVGILDGISYGVNDRDRSNKLNKYKEKQLIYHIINSDGTVSIADNPDYLDNKKKSFEKYCNKPSEIKYELNSYCYSDNNGNLNWGYRNSKGEDVSREEYSSTSNFENGFAVIKRKGQEAYLIVNKKFEVIKELDKRFKPLSQLGESLNFQNGLIQVSQLIKSVGGIETWEYYLINTNGDIIKKMNVGVIPQTSAGF